MFYQVTLADPGAHLFRVKCIIDNPDSNGQRLSLPSWIPGSYMLREFSKNIISISATSKGKNIQISKLDKSTWQCEACDTALEIEYDVYAWDLSVRTAHFDQTHAYFNGTSLFLKAEGQEHLPVALQLVPPKMVDGNGWRVATSLACDGAELWGFGQYKAANYDELIDHPVEIGKFDVLTFESGGIPHDIVLSGKHYADTGRIITDLKKICDTHIAMFGELPPIDRYLFLVWIVGDGYGGLEHRASTSLLVSRTDLPKKNTMAVSDSYRSFLGLCSHEYFHTWNIKRIKPEVFMPYQLESESYTRQLWAFEGITSYYDDLGLVRSGCISVKDYLQVLAETVTRVIRGSGRYKQSVAESSFDAWTKFYRQDENAPNAIVSYYTKGSLIALALDLLIREKTAGEKSLDDVLRKLWREYGVTSVGVPEKKIEKIAEEIAGIDLTEFFLRYLYGFEDLPLAEIFSNIGIEYTQRPACSLNDKGGPLANNNEEKLSQRTDLGIRSGDVNGELKVSHVFDGGAGMKAGIAAGDILLAIDCTRLTSNNLEKTLAMHEVGNKLVIHLFRGDILMMVNVTLQSSPKDTVELRLIDDLDSASLARRKAWLGR